MGCLSLNSTYGLGWETKERGMQIARSMFPTVVQANFGAATLGIAILGLSYDIRSFLIEEPWVAASLVVASEALILFTIWFMNRDSTDVERPHIGLIDAIGEDLVELRFACESDYMGMEAVYGQWFKSNSSIADAEYCDLIRRGNLIRVAELKESSGTHEWVKIDGYYSIFPMSNSTFSALVEGSLKENQINSSLIFDPSDPRAEIIYIPEICASKDSKIGKILTRDLVKYVYYLLKINNNLEMVGAWAYSKFGERLVNDFRMTRLNANRTTPKMYKISRNAALSFPPKGKFLPKRKIIF